jgi:hypothetical protein
MSIYILGVLLADQNIISVMLREAAADNIRGILEFNRLYFFGFPQIDDFDLVLEGG